MAQRRPAPEDQIREAILSVRGVASCNVEVDRDGEILAVHIVTRTGRTPKHIVRDVESALSAEFGITLDHRKVSVASLESKPAIKLEKATRPKFVSMKLSTWGGRGRCGVVLEREDLEVTGEASGVVTGSSRLRLIAKATFRAVERLVDDDVQFDLLDVVRLNSGDRDSVVVLAIYVSGRDAKRLAGCVQINDNEQQAAVLAALDACNRIIEISPQVEHTEYEVSPFEDR